MDIEMVPVSSSNLESVGYDSSTQTMKIRFLNGSEYVFLNIPPLEFESLIQASSIGSYFNRNIRNSYPYEKIG